MRFMHTLSTNLCVYIASSSWSPTIDSPDSPLRQQHQSTPPPATRGRGGGGPRHYKGPLEDGHFHPPPPQRRHLLGTPSGPQKFTFHNIRVQDLIQTPAGPPPRSLLPAPMTEVPSRRGGYVPSSPASWSSEEGQRMETSETDSSHSQEQRDPRLKRKLPPQVPVTQVAMMTKRKQDIHLIVHQILSEHSYCKGGGSESEPQPETKNEEKSANSAFSASSFLSVIEKKVPSRSRLRRSARKKVKSGMPKPEVLGGTSEALNDEDKSKVEKPNDAQSRVLPSPIRSCISHPEELSRLCCVSCHKLICRKCVGKDGAHHDHDYGLLQWDGKNAMLVKVESPAVGVKGAPLKPMVGEKVSRIVGQGTKLESKGGKKVGKPVVGDEGPQVEARLESKPSVKRGHHLKPIVEAQAEDDEGARETVQVKDLLAGVKEPPSVLDPTHFNSDSGVEFNTEGFEHDDFVTMGDFDLDIDSDGFSSSDEVVARSCTETIAVKDQDDHQVEPSYIISLPTTWGRPMAKLCPNTQAAGTTIHTAVKPSYHDSQACTAATPHPDTPAVEYHPKAYGGDDVAAVTGEDTSGDTIQAVVEATESLKRLLDGSDAAEQVITKGGPTSQWSISNYDPRKNRLRLSRVDKMGEESHGQLLSNRLALYASNSSPSGSNCLADPCELSHSEDTPLSGEGTDLDTPSWSSLDSASSLLSFPSEERVGRGMRRGSGMRGRGMRKRNSRKCVQMTTRRTRAAMDLDDEEIRPPVKRRRRARGRRGARGSCQGFRAEVLTTRSRAETATMKRRQEMEEEIERHDRERLLTARPEDLEQEYVPSPASAQDILDDLSSEALSSFSLTSGSSPVSSRDIDGSSTRSIASFQDDFSPDVVARCKKIATARSSGDTPLHKVCRTGKCEMARYLITMDYISVNAQDYAGWTPLHEACCSNHLDIADLLLKAGADANVCATDGTRPIHDAIESGNLDLVKLLVSNGADPMAEIGERTPVEFALANQQMEVHAFLQSVIKEKLKAKSQKSTPVSSPSRVVQKKQPTRASKKDGLFKEAGGDSEVSIPVDGYGSDGPYCGEDLSYPLFYASPIIELSDCPFLPAYNFKLSSGTNPRRHNFHLISDILDSLDITEQKLLKRCDKVVPLEMTVAKVIEQMESSFYKLPERVLHYPLHKKLRFLPICSQLRQLLDILVENLDD